jgi:D-serine deaminase-like pyridoxal phosphate-dependent protein
MDIRKPTLCIDERIARENIRMMVAKAARQSVLFRPHFKTHQSVEVGQWFRQAGVTAITVSSVSMARKFADAGWRDITIAFPMNIRETEEVCALATWIKLNVLFDKPEQAAAMAKVLKQPAGFYIKVDTGYHRAGVLPGDRETMEAILSVAAAGSLEFRGFLTHSGQTYMAENPEAVMRISRESRALLSGLKVAYSGRFPGLITSVGDTPSCSIGEDFSGADEIRPGNFVYYDLMQLRLGSCRFGQLAAAVICPVVSVYPSRNQALIYGGAVHLSKETLMQPDGSKIYGLAVPFTGGRWGLPEGEDYIVSLSQEHGLMRTGSRWAASLRPGDLVAIVPVHSCLAVDLLKDTVTSLVQ